ncbi:MAG TPA: tandem-95 repeat protein, partial [Ohtaekwangia sp.]|nr:tandem-95 repeat protein [Ohtaekwangia sp.]
MFTGSAAFGQIPITIADVASTVEDVPVQIAVLANDFEILNTILPSTVDVDLAQAGVQSSVSLPAGTFAAASDGLVTFDPAPNTSGLVLHSYTVKNELDVTSLPGLITITVTAVNDLPAAVDDATATTEDNPVSINVTSNDTDVEAPVNPASVDLDPVSGGRQVSVNVTEGSFTVDNAGTVTYTPALNFSGVVIQQYTVEDNTGAVSNAATITITVSAVNDIPVAGNDATTTNEDTPVSLNIIANDSDPEAALAPASVDLNTETAGVQHTVTTAAG